MRATIHQITYGQHTYFKVYAENLNGRMTLVSKRKFSQLKEAREFAKIMLPSHKLDRKVREVKF
jgi:hypothetical protein